MAPVVRNLFQIRSQSFFDPNIVSLGVLSSIFEALYANMNFSIILNPGSPILFSIICAMESDCKAKN